jgi:hypothetical protein
MREIQQARSMSACGPKQRSLRGLRTLIWAAGLYCIRFGGEVNLENGAVVSVLK